MKAGQDLALKKLFRCRVLATGFMDPMLECGRWGAQLRSGWTGSGRCHQREDATGKTGLLVIIAHLLKMIDALPLLGMSAFLGWKVLILTLAPLNHLLIVLLHIFSCLH